MIEPLPADVCLEQAANCFAFEGVHTYMVYRSCCDINKTTSQACLQGVRSIAFCFCHFSSVSSLHIGLAVYVQVPFFAMQLLCCEQLI